MAKLLNREPDALAHQVLIGPAEDCAAKLSRYAAAGVGFVFIWPLADETAQLERFMRDVAPNVPHGTPAGA